MLDILGNVFGRSKKEKSGHHSTPGSPASSSAVTGDSAQAASADGFAVVGQDASSSNAFIYPTMLTNEMLRPSSTATPAAAAAAAASPASTSASSSSTSRPFASGSTTVPYSGPTQSTNTWNSHTDSLTLQRSSMINGMSQINPMDQVPFVPHAAFDPRNGSSSADPKSEDVRRCAAAIDRVAGFLSAPSQSEYNFEVERNVIRESSVSSWQSFA